jgi:hypothetical protein
MLFSLSKQGRGVFLSHLALIEVFSMAFIRAAIPVLYSQGFNPLPKLNFASPLSVGIAADAEIATVDLDLSQCNNFSAEVFTVKLNPVLPEGIVIQDALKVIIPNGVKKYSVPALLWGHSYTGPKTGGTAVLVPAKAEKTFRQKLTAGTAAGIFGLRRKAVLAVTPGTTPERPESYFAVYREFYPEDSRL